MHVYHKSLNFKKLLDIDSCFHLLCDIVISERLFDTLLFSVKPILEYAFGICIGYVVGWAIGLFIGESYAEYFAPAFLVDLGQLSYWRLLPYGFARTAGITVAIIGVLVVALINDRLLNERVISLYRSGTTDPQDIARTLGESVGLIERKMDKLL